MATESTPDSKFSNELQNRFTFNDILTEIKNALDTSDMSQSPHFLEQILKARVCVTLGAGRVGLVMKAFAKRLRHLGLESFDLQDSVVPSTGPGDVLIVGSGSGSTPSIRTLANVAHGRGLTLLLITATRNSPVEKLSAATLYINAPTKFTESTPHSIQPMTSLFEQSLAILTDTLVINMMALMQKDSLSMRDRHNTIE
jgi:6-phospho-3-hexuloisomerase